MIGILLRPALVDQAIVSGGNFLTVVIAAHFLPEAEQGKYAYLLTIYLAASTLNAAFIFQWANVEAPRSMNRVQYKGDLARVQLGLAFVTVIMAALALKLTNGLLGWQVTYTDIAVISAFLLVQQAAEFSRRALYIFRSSAYALASSIALYLPRIALLLLLVPQDFADFTLILALSSLAPVAYFSVLLVRAGGSSFNPLYFARRQPPEARWLMLSGPLVWLASALPVFVAGGILSIEAVGVLMVVRSLVNVANVLMELLETELSARVGRLVLAQPHEVSRLYTRVQTMGMSLWLAGALGIMVCGGSALSVVFGASYESYGNLLLLLWLATGINFLFRLGLVEARTNGYGKIVLLAYFAAIAAIAISAVPLASHFGLTGSAFTIVAGVTTSLLVIKSHKRLHHNFANQ